jgi:hypothetical protein
MKSLLPSRRVCFMRVRTPVVLIVFNRPGCTERVLECLARFKPASLFVVGDGPRATRQDDGELVKLVRKQFQRLPWPCDVQLNLSEENLGCRRRVTSGLDWVFRQVDEAVILEDDIVPGESFFPFCEELLDRYRGDHRIASISGTDFTGGRHRFPDSYAFSRYNLFWGWATWRRAWALYDDSMSFMSEASDEAARVVVRRTFRRWRERVYWNAVLRRVAREEIDSWGYRWLFSCWRAGMLGVQPMTSVVENIGTGDDATHTRHGTYGIGPARKLVFPLRHPHAVIADGLLDQCIEDRIYSKSLSARLAWLWNRIKGRAS